MYTWAVFLSAFGMFVITSAPLVTTGDSGELVAAAFTLGIPHPPGYPLYMLLGKAATLLPVGNVASRTNMLAGILVALCAVMVYLSGCELAGKKRSDAAAAVALGWAFSRISWSQATYSEVYPLQLLLSLAALYAAVRTAREPDFRYAATASFFTGLSIAGHYAAIMYVPAVAFFILYSGRIKWGVAMLAWVAAFFTAGLSAFIYLPARAMTAPLVNWGNPDSPARFIRHITRASYGDLGAVAIKFAGGGRWAVIAALACIAVAAMVIARRSRYKMAWDKTAAISVWLVSAALSAYVVTSGVTSASADYFIKTAYSGGIAAAVPFVLIGLWAAYRKDLGSLLSVTLLLFVAGSVTLYRIPVTWSFDFTSLSDKFFLSFGAAAYIIAAAGAAHLFDGVLPARFGLARAGYVCAVIPAAFIAVNYTAMDQSRNYLAHDYTTAILRTLEQDSVFLANGDNHIFLSAYARFVEEARPDVDIFASDSSPFPGGAAASIAMADRRRPVYSSTDQISGVVLEPAGILNRYPTAYDRPLPDDWGYYHVRAGDDLIKHAGLEAREILAEYYFTQARQKMVEGDEEAMFGLLDKSVDAGRNVMWANIGVADIYMNYGRFPDAYKLLARSLKAAPFNPEVNLKMGKYFMLTGGPDKAEVFLKKAAGYNKGLSEAYLLLADVREMRGDFAGARYALEGYLGSGAGVDRVMAEARLRALSEQPIKTK